MYSSLLLAHSYFRWLAICVVIVGLLWIYWKKQNQSLLTKKDLNWLLLILICIDIQFLLGWLTYLQSPLVKAFWSGFPKTVKARELRFFGMEHVTSMSVAMLLVNFAAPILRLKSRLGQAYFKQIWIFALLVGLLILLAIPWSFSPFTARPNWR